MLASCNEHIIAIIMRENIHFMLPCPTALTSNELYNYGLWVDRFTMENNVGYVVIPSLSHSYIELRIVVYIVFMGSCLHSVIYIVKQNKNLLVISCI